MYVYMYVYTLSQCFTLTRSLPLTSYLVN